MNLFLGLISAILILIVPAGTAAAQRPAVMHEDPSNAMLPEALSLLSDYIAIPSESGNEIEAGNFLMDFCKDRGFHVMTFDSDTAGINFVASLYPLEEGKPNIIFHNHIDVVHPGEQADWKHPPYSGTVSGQKVWGRRSIDNKGLAVIQVMAASSFISLATREELPYNVSILSVSGEETGGQRGSAIIAEKYLDMLHPAVIIGEGSCGFENMELLGIDGPVFGISIADKSMLWLEISVRGEEFGHASTHADSYTNKKMVEGLYRILGMPQKVSFNDASLLMFKHIGNIRGGFRGFAIRNLDHFPFRSVLKKYVKKEPRLEALACNTITVTHLHNPEGCINQHSSEAHAYLDCRLLPGFTSGDIISDIQKVLDDDAFRIRIMTEGPPALITEPDGFYHIMVASINDVFPDAGVIPVLFPATTDNNYFRGKDFPVYGINPFYMSMDQISTIHNLDEYMDIEDLRVGIEVFRVFIAKMMEEGLAF